MKKKKTLKERGEFKATIYNILIKDPRIQKIVLNDLYDSLNEKERIKKMRDFVFTHLFVNDTIKEVGTFIYFDIYFPRMRDQIKTCKITMYAMTHRDLLDTYHDPDMIGNRADCLAEYIEDVLVNDPENKYEFGIGTIVLESALYVNTANLYGTEFLFDVRTFR